MYGLWNTDYAQKHAPTNTPDDKTIVTGERPHRVADSLGLIAGRLGLGWFWRGSCARDHAAHRQGSHHFAAAFAGHYAAQAALWLESAASAAPPVWPLRFWLRGSALVDLYLARLWPGLGANSRSDIREAVRAGRFCRLLDSAAAGPDFDGLGDEEVGQTMGGVAQMGLCRGRFSRAALCPVSKAGIHATADRGNRSGAAVAGPLAAGAAANCRLAAGEAPEVRRP